MPEIDCVASLLDLIEKMKKDYPGRSIYFRGQQRKFEKIEPSIARDGFLSNEDSLFREYFLRNPQDFVDDKTTFEKLVKMQHYGLPTRLLDITSNPLVALFFAVEEGGDCERENGDFVVFPVPQNRIKFYDSDVVSVVSNVAKRPCDHFNLTGLIDRCDSQFAIETFNKSNQIKYLIHDIKNEKPYFEAKIIRSDLESIWCVRPLIKNRRIAAQDGLFLLFGVDGGKSRVATYDAELEPKRFPVVDKIRIRRELNDIGVTYEKIYPELDKVAIALRKKYMNREQITISPSLIKPEKAGIFV